MGLNEYQPDFSLTAEGEDITKAIKRGWLNCVIPIMVLPQSAPMN